MKSKRLFVMVVVMVVALASCSDDNGAKRKGDPDIAHTGDKWTVTSVEYLLIDQSTSGQVMKSDTKANAGSFYFVPGATNGSFEMDIEGYNKEDAFNYTFSEGSVSIISIEQGVGTTVSQNILALNGEQSSDTEMSLTGTITKQSTTGQFILTVIGMTLTKN
jgi:hypothetical protein